MHFFDLQHTLLAKHAQHIVLVHFPIALVCVALLFDLLALRWSDRGFAAAAYLNLSIAAAAVLPVAITGLLAWKWQLEGAPLRGVLRLHLLLGVSSVVMIAATWFAAKRTRGSSSSWRIAMEFTTVAVVAVTAHLGGFVSGVNV
ncbi:rubrerythrin-like protein [Candidatus Koribacter versatilis Ellin345]|uniref:Rubrerythrin-like protein n=1 Tax=Koribacter versatilis (strain Ellin345) TaxID=204669 RepID=Q1IHF9_KORVE|nr:DUF2231 domain-containing protein [Candidatus Koribacter versatilis]ABF43691.1 rubrerythrin-like protein [Candidatus Koribacter versatilis Ellin345]